jgi:hypothetical protein
VVELGVVLQDLICLLSLCQPLSCNTPPWPLRNPSLTPNYIGSLDNPLSALEMGINIPS